MAKGKVVLSGKYSRGQREMIASVAAELARRKQESLNLYVPLEAAVGFHKSKAPERILRGSVRGGKTLAACVEVARACTGSDPYGKYPRSGTAIVVGKDTRQLGKVVCKYLIGGHREGPFKVIRDPETGLMRLWQPWIKYDDEHRQEAKQAGPLIPKRLIKSISWYEKRENIPRTIYLKNGWTIMCASSEGDPIQGVSVDLVLFDEEIRNESWYSEASSRLVDRDGVFIWSAAPQLATEHFYALHERAEEELKNPPESRAVEEFPILLESNPYIRQSSKTALFNKLSEDERIARYEGQYAIESMRVFPEFSERVHCIDPFPEDEFGQIVPPGWTRYMAVDPGHQVCAVVFLAVPPAKTPDPYGQVNRVYVYDELYIKGCTASIFAEEVKRKTQGFQFYNFFIDSKSGRVTEMGVGKTIQAQYAEELGKRGVSSKLTGSNFSWGSTDVQGGLANIRRWLEVRPEDGVPKLAIFRTCEKLVWEMKHYYKRTINGVKTDKPQQKNDHAIWCLRCLASHDPRYRAIKQKAQANKAYEKWLEKRRQRKIQRKSYVRLGPPPE